MSVRVRAVLLLAVVLDLALAGGEDRPVVDLTGAERARRAAAGVGRAGVERRRRVDAVLDVHQLDARRVLVDEAPRSPARGIVERVGGPEGVDLAATYRGSVRSIRMSNAVLSTPLSTYLASNSPVWLWM